MPTPILDGRAALEDALGKTKILSIVARNTVFLHPDTVRQAGPRAMFPIVRAAGDERRGARGTVGGEAVVLCDNRSPTDAFLWAAHRSKGPDVQFNHIWPSRRNPRLYTALWNLCVTPAFLAKLTDNDRDVMNALRCRSYDLYGYLPDGEQRPEEPAGYSALHWAPPPPVVRNLESEFRKRMKSVTSSRCTMAAREIGWTFSGFRPDPTVE